MWEDIFRALALVLIIEGIMPFAFPGKWRASIFQLASLDDKKLRTMGVSVMIIGLLGLQMVRYLA